MSDAPLSDTEADACFSELRGAPHLLIAVSGGPDSVALLATLASWTGRGDAVLTAATVDHGLRRESAAEAQNVGHLAQRLGVRHHVLHWVGQKPPSGLPEAARSARYRLLTDLAAAIGATHLVTAHTLDDQAETILMRLAAGTGLAGLAGMPAVTRRAGLNHVRPFLSVAKARLIATCHARSLPFATDPSNADERFARARWRSLAPILAREGLTAERLARLAERMGRAEDALRSEAGRLIERSRRPDGNLDLGEWAQVPFEIACRALAQLLPAEGADGHPLRLERLERLTQALRDAVCAGTAIRRTLAGRLLTLSATGTLAVSAEPPRRRGLGGAKMPQAAVGDIVHLAEAFPLATAPCTHTLGDTCDRRETPVAGRDR